MKSGFPLRAAAALAALLSSPALAQLSATDDQGATGSVSLVFSKARVAVGPQWIDVEEEAEISVQQNRATPADSWLVEGNFGVPTGSVVVGCLLWNDDTLLMGRLRGKADATHKFDSLVPPLPATYRHDPLQIDQVGDSTYHLRLYPVPVGGSRRIRIRYLAPVVSGSGAIPVLPVLSQVVSSLPANWTLDLRGQASGLKLFHDGNWFPISIPARRTLDFATCGSTQLDWQSSASDGSRAVRSRIDSGSWAGDYVLFTGKLPDSVARRVDIRSETVFLWRWIQPSSFVGVLGDNTRAITDWGQMAIDQSRSIVSLSSQLVQMGNKVGLVADQGLDDTTIVFPLSDSASPDFRRMKSWLNGVDAEYIQWRIPRNGTGSAEPGDLEIAKNRQRFRTDFRLAGTLYSRDSGIVRELVVVTVGPDSSGGDLKEMPDLSVLPENVMVSSSQLQQSSECGYYDGYNYTCRSIPPKPSKWPGVDLDGVAAARSVAGKTDSVAGVPLPRFRTRLSATLAMSSSQGEIARDVVLQRGPDGSWNTSLNAQAKGMGKQVTWSFFDASGEVISSWVQTPIWQVVDGDSALPRLWAVSAGRISPNFEGYTTLAPVFGFVDRQYSLLAMPSDSMGRTLQAVYADSGLPFLSSRDIFWKTGTNHSSGIRASFAAWRRLSVALISGRRVRIDLVGVLAGSVEIRDLRGHKVAGWDRSALVGLRSLVWDGRSGGASAPAGLYLIQVRTQDGRSLVASIALP